MSTSRGIHGCEEISSESPNINVIYVYLDKHSNVPNVEPQIFGLTIFVASRKHAPACAKTSFLCEDRTSIISFTRNEKLNILRILLVVALLIARKCFSSAARKPIEMLLLVRTVPLLRIHHVATYSYLLTLWKRGVAICLSRTLLLLARGSIPCGPRTGHYPIAATSCNLKSRNQK